MLKIHFAFHRIPELLSLERISGVPLAQPLLKQVHAKQVVQDGVQTGFEYLQGRRLHSFCGQPVPGLCHPLSKRIFPRI